MIGLIGYMGSGKTTIARQLGLKLNLPIYDLDQEIEQFTGISITEIFENYGDYYFRKTEKRILKKTLENSHGIMSLGGGTPCFYDNIVQIKKNTLSFYLQSTREDLYDRLIHEKSTRPLIAKMEKSELENYISSSLDKREMYYLKADHIINNTDIEESVNQIVALYYENIY